MPVIQTIIERIIIVDSFGIAVIQTTITHVHTQDKEREKKE